MDVGGGSGGDSDPQDDAAWQELAHEFERVGGDLGQIDSATRQMLQHLWKAIEQPTPGESRQTSPLDEGMDMESRRQEILDRLFADDERPVPTPTASNCASRPRAKFPGHAHAVLATVLSAGGGDCHERRRHLLQGAGFWFGGALAKVTPQSCLLIQAIVPPLCGGTWQ